MKEKSMLKISQIIFIFLLTSLSFIPNSYCDDEKDEFNPNCSVRCGNCISGCIKKEAKQERITYCAQNEVDDYEVQMKCRLTPEQNAERISCICNTCLNPEQPCDGCPGRHKDTFCVSQE